MSGNASSAITVLTKITLHPPPANLIDLNGHLFLRYTNHQLHVNEAIYYTIGIKITN